ncbi:NYN domain protein [Gemmata sp. SH-PL17]|uniref:NYN domain-containing protein n=1 Tax=Gemmata sp. SH-PL17 TaxID=1630693 RepID=UPI00078C5B41|nr:NYN domain-containing protein [Gemmata sp. SH-PL17]AMV26805.1 NYN domain protein [Gemmata sp. SH-PL17]
MKPSAVLLIDLENFFLSRVDYFNNRGIRVEERPSFAEDMKNLVRHAQRMTGLPFAVRRAYADFETLRVEPQDLMRQGVEPVQVFRLSGKSANKNAADMKLAMDAVALLGPGAPLEHFVLVSGDADFIPVILELKRRGHTVSVIAVTGATNDLIQRFADKFELFESLVPAGSGERQVRAPIASEPPKSNGRNGFKSVTRTGTRPTPAERPTLEPHTAEHYKYLLASGRTDANEARVLTVPWSALVWICDAVVTALTPPSGSPATSIELMARLQAAARITGITDLAAHVALIHSAVRCSLPVPSAPGGAYTLATETTGEEIRQKLLRYVVYVLNCRLSENGVKGPIRAESLAAAFDSGTAMEQATAEIVTALAEPEFAPPPAASRPSQVSGVHTPDEYRKLLQKGGAKGTDTEHTRIHPTPWPSIERVCADTFTALHPSAGGAGTLQRGQLLERLYATEDDMRVDNYRSHVRRAFTLLGLSHAILEEDERVSLHPDVTEPGHIRWAVLGIMLKLLAIRLEEKGVPEPIQPEAFVAAIEAGPFTDELLPEIATTILSVYQSSDETELVPILEPDATAPTEESAEFAAADSVENSAPMEEATALDVDPFAFDSELFDKPPHPEPPKAPELVDVPASEIVDVSAITSEAVAAVIEPAVQVIPIADVEPLPIPSESELVVFAPSVENEGEPVEEVTPVAEWVPDEDVLFSGLEIGAERFPAGSSTRLVPPSAETRAPADKITPPSIPPSALLPPLPPSPPEPA